MGTTSLFKCTKCNYKVESSGQLDWGWTVAVRPFICKDCKIVVDIVVSEHREIGDTNLPPPMLKRESLKCPKCRGKNLTVWHPRYRQCPKCGGWMKKDKDGRITLWD